MTRERVPESRLYTLGVHWLAPSVEFRKRFPNALPCQVELLLFGPADPIRASADYTSAIKRSGGLCVGAYRILESKPGWHRATRMLLQADDE